MSMSVLGTIQSNTRPEGPANKVRRTSGSFFVPAPTKPGISREGTEFSFGLPVSAGIGLRYDFNPRWGIGTGVVYTNLSRSFLGDYGKELEDGTRRTGLAVAGLEAVLEDQVQGMLDAGEGLRGIVILVVDVDVAPPGSRPTGNRCRAGPPG